jgi:hypothetical protein
MDAGLREKSWVTKKLERQSIPAKRLRSGHPNPPPARGALAPSPYRFARFLKLEPVPWYYGSGTDQQKRRKGERSLLELRCRPRSSGRDQAAYLPATGCPLEKSLLPPSLELGERQLRRGP